MPKYKIITEPDADGVVTVQRVADQKLARVMRSFFKPFSGEEGVFIAKSNVKAIRLDGIDWTEEL
jgi:hypothetical protein